MSLGWNRLSRCRRHLALAAFLLSTAFVSSSAQAQATNPGRVDATPKGTIGASILGAELGLVLPTAFGLSETWSLITFPLVGAGGGAAAGYFLIDNQNRSTISVAVLVSALALAVPSTVLAVHFASYDPEEQRAQAAPALLRMDDNGVRAGVPSVVVAEGSREDLKGSDMLQGTKRRPELHFGLLSGRF